MNRLILCPSPEALAQKLTQVVRGRHQSLTCLSAPTQAFAEAEQRREGLVQAGMPSLHPPPPEECHDILTQPSIHQDFKGLVGAGCDSGECLDDQVQVQQLSILNGSQVLHSLEQSPCSVGHHCVDEPELEDRRAF